MRPHRLAGLLTTGAILAALVVPASASAADDAMIRVLHGSPDAPSVDVFANDVKVDALSGLTFGDISDYVAVPAGTYSIKVCATADNTVCPIGPVDLPFAAGERYTIAASDYLASIDANVFTDGRAMAGKAKVRVVHLSADTPAVDVLTEDGTTTVVDSLAYPDATAYLELDPGTYDLKVCADADNTVCPLNPDPLDLAGGTAYSVFAIGSIDPAEGAQGLTAVVAADDMAAPATDAATMTGTTGQGGSVSLAALVALALAAVVGLTAGLRRATVRVRR